MTWDVIVVGAGPAGCHAAGRLARLGWSVLLVDRARFPRWKPCAGGITVKAATSLPEPLRELVEHTADRVLLSRGPRTTTRLSASRPVGWMVHRETFDHAHLDLVRALPGLEVREACRVEAVREETDRVVVECGSGRLVAAAVVGADGAESVVSRAVRDPAGRAFAVAYEAEALLDGEGPEVQFDLEAFPGGYGWVFPKRGRCSLGGYVMTGSARELRARLDHFRAAWPHLAGLRPYRARGYRLPLGGTRAPLATRRIVLAGDAADTVDPLTGEGIAHAFRSAALAADAVHRLLAEGEPLVGHTRTLWYELHRDLRLSRRLAGLLYRHPRRGFDLLFSNRILCGLFVRALRGETTYRGLVGTALKRLPALLSAYDREEQLSFEVE